MRDGPVRGGYKSVLLGVLVCGTLGCSRSLDMGALKQSIKDVAGNIDWSVE